jgi:hypothetical protein
VGRKRKFIAEVARSAAEQRELIRERVRADRESKLSDYQRQEIIKRRAAGETIDSIAKSSGVQKDVISHLCKAAGVRNKLAPEDRISGVPTAIARPERD